MTTGKGFKIHTVQLNLEDLHDGTMHMDAQEFGVYVRLFLACYRVEDCSLPNDDLRLSRIAKCSMKVWNRVKPVVVDKFVDKDGRLYHERVAKDALAYKERSAINKANRLKGLENDQRTVNQSQTNRPLPTTYHSSITKNPSILPRESGSFPSENGEGRSPVSPVGFNIQHHLSDQHMAKARSSAPGWDIYFLMRAFNGWVVNEKIDVKSPVGLFLGWIPKFTKGKKP